MLGRGLKEQAIVISRSVALVPSELRYVLRHEIGHAGQAALGAPATQWLEKELGWKLFRPGRGGIEGWLCALDVDGRLWKSLTQPERDAGLEFLDAALGNGGEQQLSDADLANDYPCRAHPNSPYKAGQVSLKANPYYADLNEWPVADDSAFALNPHYAMGMSVRATTLALVGDAPPTYASASPNEFFAELYALYRAPKNPKHSKIPKETQDWLSKALALLDETRHR